MFRSIVVQKEMKNEDWLVWRVQPGLNLEAIDVNDLHQPLIDVKGLFVDFRHLDLIFFKLIPYKLIYTKNLYKII